MQTVLDTAKLINDREILMRLQVRLPVQTVSMETGATRAPATGRRRE